MAKTTKTNARTVKNAKSKTKRAPSRRKQAGFIKANPMTVTGILVAVSAGVGALAHKLITLN